MIRFKTAEGTDPKVLKALWHEAFGEDYDSIDLFFETLYAPENALIAENEETLLSALYLLEGEMTLDEGKSVPVDYVFAAATALRYRRRGIMRTLLDFAAETSEKRGKAALCLLPGETSLEAYYRTCGFCAYFTAREQIFPYMEPGASILENEPETTSELNMIRNRFLENSSGNILFPEHHANFASRYQHFVSVCGGYALVCDLLGERRVISEFFVSPEHFDALFSKICERFPAKEYALYTAPCCMEGNGIIIKRGMIRPLGGFELPKENTPYLGMTLE